MSMHRNQSHQSNLAHRSHAHRSHAASNRRSRAMHSPLRVEPYGSRTTVPMADVLMWYEKAGKQQPCRRF